MKKETQVNEHQVEAKLKPLNSSHSQGNSFNRNNFKKKIKKIIAKIKSSSIKDQLGKIAKQIPSISPNKLYFAYHKLKESYEKNSSTAEVLSVVEFLDQQMQEIEKILEIKSEIKLSLINDFSESGLEEHKKFLGLIDYSHLKKFINREEQYPEMFVFYSSFIKKCLNFLAHVKKNINEITRDNIQKNIAGLYQKCGNLANEVNDPKIKAELKRLELYFAWELEILNYYGKTSEITDSLTPFKKGLLDLSLQEFKNQSIDFNGTSLEEKLIVPDFSALIDKNKQRFFGGIAELLMGYYVFLTSEKYEVLKKFLSNFETQCTNLIELAKGKMLKENDKTFVIFMLQRIQTLLNSFHLLSKNPEIKEKIALIFKKIDGAWPLIVTSAGPNSSSISSSNESGDIVTGDDKFDSKDIKTKILNYCTSINNKIEEVESLIHSVSTLTPETVQVFTSLSDQIIDTWKKSVDSISVEQQGKEEVLIQYSQLLQYGTNLIKLYGHARKNLSERLITSQKKISQFIKDLEIMKNQISLTISGHPDTMFSTSSSSSSSASSSGLLYGH